MISPCRFTFDGLYDGFDEYTDSNNQTRSYLQFVVQAGIFRVPVNGREKKVYLSYEKFLKQLVRVSCVLKMMNGRKIYDSVSIDSISPRDAQKYGAFEGICEPLLHSYEKNQEFFDVVDLSFFGSNLQLTNDEELVRRVRILGEVDEARVAGRFRWEPRHKKSGDAYYQALEPQFFDVRFVDSEGGGDVKRERERKGVGGGADK